MPNLHLVELQVRFYIATLRYALDAHPDICCPPELRLAALGLHLMKIVDLTSVEVPSEMDAKLPERLKAARGVIDHLMEHYCQRKGKTRWCDKSPANTDILFVLASLFPDAQYICLHRLCLDQVHSTLDMEGTARLQPFLSRQGGGTVAAAIDRWCTSVERLLAFEHAYGERVRRITYERFVAAPEEELCSLQRFLNVPVVPGLSVAAFAKEHDRGPADMKIAGANKVDPGRIGRGRSIGLKGVSSELMERCTRLGQSLGYQP